MWFSECESLPLVVLVLFLGELSGKYDNCNGWVEDVKEATENDCL